MVDDHPMILEGYKNTLIENYQDHPLEVEEAANCDDAIRLIHKNAKTRPYDIALIDIKLPPSSDGTVVSGEGLAKLIQKEHKGIKVIILTMHNESQRINNIMHNVNPDGFLIKSDLTSEELLRAFGEVLEGRTYYSARVNSYFRKIISNNFTLDDKNLQILHHLSRGVQTKNLGNYVNLSLSAIEKRKSHIKELFDIKSGTDEMLIDEARKRGFV